MRHFIKPDTLCNAVLDLFDFIILACTVVPEAIALSFLAVLDFGARPLEVIIK